MSLNIFVVEIGVCTLFLYRYITPEEIMNHIGSVQYMGMTTDTPAALVVRILTV